MVKILILIYMLLPLLIIPYIAYKEDNWYILFGIAFYYMGVFLVAIKQMIYLSIPVLFCIWFWYTFGFSIYDYVTSLFLCMTGGVIFYQIRVELDKLITRTIPQKRQDKEYDSKIDEMYSKLEKYKKEHPNEKLNQEIIDNIKMEIFF